MTTITTKRLKELEKNIRKSYGWDAFETPAERKIINKRWDKMAGNTSFHDAVKQMIKDRSRKNTRLGCPNSYSGEHAFETYGVPKGKIRCVHCGLIKSIKKAK